MNDTTGFRGWCVVELMGHVTLAGYVSEQEIAGTKLLRIDVPEIDDRAGFSKMVGASAIYGLTPVNEATVMTVCREGAHIPFSSWSLEAAFRRYLQEARPQIEAEVEADVKRRLGHLTEPAEPDHAADDDDFQWF